MQKTSYEMRISDWSSDVCSSDLPITTIADLTPHPFVGYLEFTDFVDTLSGLTKLGIRPQFRSSNIVAQAQAAQAGAGIALLPDYVVSPDMDLVPVLRSEEHTSELQSLMRTSYAVFCLKKTIIHPVSNPHLVYIILLSKQHHTDHNLPLYDAILS